MCESSDGTRASRSPRFAGRRARRPLLLGLLAAAVGAAATHAQAPLELADGEVQLGFVREGRFVLWGGERPAVRLTTVGRHDRRSPEAGEIDLSAWEGRAVAVTGEPGHGWMHSVEVREKAGAVVSAALRRLSAETRHEARDRERRPRTSGVRLGGWPRGDEPLPGVARSRREAAIPHGTPRVESSVPVQ